VRTRKFLSLLRRRQVSLNYLCSIARRRYIQFRCGNSRTDAFVDRSIAEHQCITGRNASKSSYSCRIAELRRRAWASLSTDDAFINDHQTSKNCWKASSGPFSRHWPMALERLSASRGVPMNSYRVRGRRTDGPLSLSKEVPERQMTCICWRSMVSEPRLRCSRRQSIKGRRCHPTGGGLHTGRRVACMSDPSRMWRPGGGKFQTRRPSPLWSPDGRELFSIERGEAMAVSIETKPVFRAGNPRMVFRRSIVTPFHVRQWQWRCPFWFSNRFSKYNVEAQSVCQKQLSVGISRVSHSTRFYKPVSTRTCRIVPNAH
jgi:hypothetical protein